MNIVDGPLMPVSNLSVLFMSISGGEFAGYRLDMAKNMRIKFKMINGSVTSLIIQAPGKEITAQKEKKKSPVNDRNREREFLADPV